MLLNIKSPQTYRYCTAHLSASVKMHCTHWDQIQSHTTQKWPPSLPSPILKPTQPLTPSPPPVHASINTSSKADRPYGTGKAAEERWVYEHKKSRLLLLDKPFSYTIMPLEPRQVYFTHNFSNLYEYR
jgi:hypothetical protein